MSRRRPPPLWVRETQPGLEAQYDGVCGRCPDPILKGDRIVYQRGNPIHVTCHSGANDE